MNFDRISHLLSDLVFRQAIWLFPFAFSLHVLEEWRQFAPWAMRYASHHFTRHVYIMIHVAGIITAFLLASLIQVLPHRWLVWVFFAFVFTPACLLQGALSRGCDGRLSGVLSRVAQGADCLSAVVLFSEPAGLS